MQSVCRWHCYIVDNVESALSQHCWPCIFFLLWIFVSTTIFKPKAQFFTIHFGISVLRIISKILSSVLREIKVNIWQRAVAEENFQFQPTFFCFPSTDNRQNRFGGFIAANFLQLRCWTKFLDIQYVWDLYTPATTASSFLLLSYIFFFTFPFLHFPALIM